MSSDFSFTEYCQIITQWQKDGYPFVYDDEFRQRIVVLDKKYMIWQMLAMRRQLNNVILLKNYLLSLLMCKD